MLTAAPSLGRNWGLLPPLHFSKLAWLLGPSPYPQEPGQRPLLGYPSVLRSQLTAKLPTTSAGLALWQNATGSYFCQESQGPTTLYALALYVLGGSPEVGVQAWLGLLRFHLPGHSRDHDTPDSVQGPPLSQPLLWGQSGSFPGRLGASGPPGRECGSFLWPACSWETERLAQGPIAVVSKAWLNFQLPEPQPLLWAVCRRTEVCWRPYCFHGEMAWPLLLSALNPRLGVQVPVAWSNHR